MKCLGTALFLAFLTISGARAQWAWKPAPYCPGTSRVSITYSGNPSFRIALGGYSRPWSGCYRPWGNFGSWGGFWPGNYWLGPVNLVSPNARRLPARLGPAPTVPDPVAILPASWVPQ